MEIKATLKIWSVGSEQTALIKIDDEELKEMNEDERGNYISKFVLEWAFGYIDIGWEEVNNG
jgi:hypothetical protein